MAKYDYGTPRDIEEAGSVTEAVRISVVNYMHHQLGWSLQRCEERVQRELSRDIPSGLFDQLQQNWGWDLEGRRLLDVGAGQGGAVLEALVRGADAHGAEPGEKFAYLAQWRLEEEGFSPARIVNDGGEALPYEDESFDYVISLRVLEHVEDPWPLLTEMYRVLRPGGRAYVACENYLAFTEQHYRVPWLPLLPKILGSLYLRSLGRDPRFLQRFVFYITYPQVWRHVSQVGFRNVTHQQFIRRVRSAGGEDRAVFQFLRRVIEALPQRAGNSLLRAVRHLIDVFRAGVRLHLVKPEH